MYMDYEWFESIPFIVLLSLFWFLVFPIPIVVYLILKRLEKKQLSRLIIAKVLGIDYYKKEIALLKKEDYEDEYELEFAITEGSFQELARTHEMLRIEYDQLAFQELINQKEVRREDVKEEHPDIDRLKINGTFNQEVEEPVEKKEEPKKKETVRRPVVKNNRIIITEEELFEDSSFDDDDFDIFF